MTGEHNGRPQLYHLDMSGEVASEIEQVIKDATLNEKGPAVLRALKTVYRRLREEPLQFGELFRHHVHLNLLVHVAVVYPVVVHFAVHPEKKFVIIQKVFLVAPSE
jgi:hypothetical protein